jgi:hypothetical protein
MKKLLFLLSILGTSFATLRAGSGPEGLKIAVNSQTQASFAGYFASVPCGTVSYTDTVSICQGDSFLVGTTYHSLAGTYADTLMRGCGGDSIITVKLDVQLPVFLSRAKDLFFSEYHRGAGFDVALEIYNPTSDTVDLSSLSLVSYNGGSTTPSYTNALAGELNPESTYFITLYNNTSVKASDSLLLKADTTLSAPGALFFTGDDAIALFRGTDTLDVIGRIGEDPGNEWPVNGTNGVNGSTKDQVLVRDSSVFYGQLDWSIAATQEWRVFAPTEYSYIGNHHTLPCAMLSPCQSTFSYDTISVCEGDSALIFGVQRKAMDTYSDTLFGQNQCGGDSIVNITLQFYKAYLIDGKDLIISEYIEGSSWNKAIEIYNPSDLAVDLGDYRLQRYANGSSTPSGLIDLSGTLAGKTTYVVCHPSASADIKAEADLQSSSVSHNGDDAIGLLKKSSNELIDVFGNIGEDPGSAWSIPGGSTQDRTLSRKAGVIQGSTDWDLVRTQFDVHPNNSTATLGSHTMDQGFIETSICEGDTIVFRGRPLFASGTYYDSLQTQENACDSIYVMVLNVLESYDTTLQTSICEGDSLLLNGQYRKTAGVYSDTLTTVTGCDSIVRIDLRIAPRSRDTLILGICAGDSAILGGRALKTTGIYADTLQSHQGCDSILVIDLTVWPSYHDTIAQSICDNDSILFGGVYLRAGGFYHDTLSSQQACDSIITLNLNVLPSSSRNITLQICEGDSLLFGGSYRKLAGSYYDTLQAANTCDSIVHLSLRVTPLLRDTTTLQICAGDSLFFGGAYRKQSGFYTSIATGSNFCDSISNLDLRVLPIKRDTLQGVVCDGDSLLFGLAHYRLPGFYTDTLRSANGCDSLSTLNLMVLPISVDTNQQQICAGDSLFFGGAYRKLSGFYSDTLSGANTCDSISVLDLLIAPLPSKPVIARQTDSLYVPPVYDEYKWFMDSVLLPNSNQAYWLAQANGTYYVEVESVDDCAVSADTLRVLITGIEDQIVSTEQAVSIYPNPSNGNLTVLLAGDHPFQEVQLYNLHGAEVYRQKLISQVRQLEIRLPKELARGVYFLQLNSETKQDLVTKKIILQ